jgi:hypothetical protein
MRYTPDEAGTGRYLREDPALRAELHRRGELGLTVARALAPRLKAPRRDRIPGALAASGQITDDGLGGIHHDRMQLSVTVDVAPGYAAAATFPKKHPDPTARDYLLAAIPIIEKG